VAGVGEGKDAISNYPFTALRVGNPLELHGRSGGENRCHLK